MNLTEVKNRLNKPKYIVFLVIAFTLVIAALWLALGSKSHDQFLPVNQQPLKNGQFNKDAQISKKAKSEVESISKKLPYSQTITTKTGTKVAYQIYKREADDYTIYVQMDGINFRSGSSDPDLPKNVLDFRDAASSALSWLDKESIATENIFIVWGDRAYIQESAQKWLKISPQFPNVIKKGDNFVFEKEPAK